ncbi:hypothetical protein IHE55_14180 [Streptomyces pactum]|uniref:Secreted protein n=1 Tax=Streptomyces pactum TaxID=68249 RepID=A0ABS0NKZ4_9ACTN|nr:hypothetical protein [Streptomyces pactum]MBH5335873.1 hypothetical protein [Streptomyces pactum]
MATVLIALIVLALASVVMTVMLSRRGQSSATPVVPVAVGRQARTPDEPAAYHPEGLGRPHSSRLF